MLKFRIYQFGSQPLPHFFEEPEPRTWLLTNFIRDMYGQEDLYLGELAKAEAGEPILDLYNNLIHVYLFPDLVVLEAMFDPGFDEDTEEGPPRCTFLTLAETKQLILDWLEAKKRWYAEHDGTEPQAALPASSATAYGPKT